MEARFSKLDRRAAEAMLRAMHEHIKAGDPIELISETIHPDAEMRLLVSFGKPVRGQAAIVAALENGRQAAIYRAQVHRHEWLDEQTSLTFAHARYALEQGGHAEGNVYWLDELRDGLIWRVQAFKSEAEARRAYEHLFEERSS
jgi:ketosteroid isomerase-like protein